MRHIIISALLMIFCNFFNLLCSIENSELTISEDYTYEILEEYVLDADAKYPRKIWFSKPSLTDSGDLELAIYMGRSNNRIVSFNEGPNKTKEMNLVNPTTIWETSKYGKYFIVEQNTQPYNKTLYDNDFSKHFEITEGVVSNDFSKHSEFARGVILGDINQGGGVFAYLYDENEKERHAIISKDLSIEFLPTLWDPEKDGKGDPAYIPIFSDTDLVAVIFGYNPEAPGAAPLEKGDKIYFLNSKREIVNEFSLGANNKLYPVPVSNDGSIIFVPLSHGFDSREDERSFWVFKNGNKVLEMDEYLEQVRFTKDNKICRISTRKNNKHYRYLLDIESMEIKSDTLIGTLANKGYPYVVRSGNGEIKVINYEKNEILVTYRFTKIKGNDNIHVSTSGDGKTVSALYGRNYVKFRVKDKRL